MISTNLQKLERGDGNFLSCDFGISKLRPTALSSQMIKFMQVGLRKIFEENGHHLGQHNGETISFHKWKGF